MVRRSFAVAALTAMSLLAQGQQVEKKVERRVEHKTHVVQGVAAGGDHMVVFDTPVAGPHMNMMKIGSGVVKGAPYAAEALTETVQVLTDGNRIINKTVSKEYRDSEGRTRRESSVQPLGPWVSGGKSLSITMIHDPVAGTSYTLHNEEKRATAMAGAGNAMFVREFKHESGGSHSKDVTVEIRKEGLDGRQAGTVHHVGPPPSGAGAAFTWIQEDGGARKSETQSLGKRVIEGLECEGTREVVKIEANAIGNERPIEIFTERWHSPELKLDVLRKHNDPRFGETTYRLQSVVRGEQPRSLFEPPADFKVDKMGGDMKFEFKTKSKE